MKNFKSFILNERNNYDDVEVYYISNDKEIFIILVKDGESIGGQYSGKPPTGESQFACMKVAIIKKYRGKGYGYGSLLYLTSLSILGERGLSPHRRKGSSRLDSQNVWIRLNEKDYIKRIPLELKLYDDNDILDSKYILTDNNMKNKFSNKAKKIGDDVDDKSNKFVVDAWKIVNKEMDN